MEMRWMEKQERGLLPSLSLGASFMHGLLSYFKQYNVTITSTAVTTTTPMPNDNLRIMSTYVPEKRPTHKEWCKQMGMNEVTYLNHPDAKERADDIMRYVGIERTLTNFERITGILMH
jgi:hypothetical protein